MSHRPLRVIKLGGSLLACDDLAAKLRNWLARQTPSCNVIVTGGGEAAELVRDAARRFRIDPDDAHWLAVSAMSLTARVICALLRGAENTPLPFREASAEGPSPGVERPSPNLSPEGSGVCVQSPCNATLVGSIAEIHAATDHALLLVDAEPLLRGAESELGPDLLPHIWDVTSDSIAARLAEVMGADELVLLKSCLLTRCHTWQDAADCGYVDPYFPQAVAEVPRTWAVNLRDHAAPQWTPSAAGGTPRRGHGGHCPPAEREWHRVQAGKPPME